MSQYFKAFSKEEAIELIKEKNLCSFQYFTDEEYEIVAENITDALKRGNLKDFLKEMLIPTVALRTCINLESKGL